MISAVNFGTGVLTARFLGPAEFGRYVLAFMVVVAANIFQQALIINPMLSIGSKKPSAETTRYFSALLLHQGALSLGLSVVIGAGLAIADALFPAGSATGLALPLMAVTIGIQWQEFMRRYFFARGWIPTAAINDAIRYGAQMIAIIVMAMWSDGNRTAQDVLLVIAAPTALSLGHAALNFGSVQWRREAIRSSVQENWRFSRWLVPSAALQALNSTSFISAAGYFQGAAVAGALRATQNVVAILNILFLGAENIVQVSAAHAYGRQGVEALRSVIMRLIVIGGGVTIAILILMSLNGERLLSLFYGRQYLEADYLVRWWALVYALNFFAIPMFIALRAMERTKNVLIAETLQMVFTLVTLYPLTRYLGANGAMLGIACCFLIVVVYYSWILRRILWRPHQVRPVVPVADRP